MKNNNTIAGIDRLPKKAQNLFNQVRKRSLKNTHNLSLSNKVAWNVLKSRFNKVNDTWVAKGLGLQFYTFSMKTNDIFIEKADNGEYYLEATLSDVGKDSDGYNFTPEALKSYADQINTHGMAGFITHKDWDEFKMNNSHLSEEDFINKARTERKGILKTVKAIFEKGKLWIKALIDKRYLNHIKKFNKVSIEALVPSKFQKDNQYTGGYVLGFALDNNAINTRASARIIE